MSEEIRKAQEMAQVAIDKINNKDFTVYFFTLDTKGNPTAGIANIYEHVKVLTELGYKACILHEKNDYHGVAGWLGTEYANLPHKSIENKDLNISASDFIIIPEVFSNVMQQTSQFPCKRIILCQSYDYILELLNIGMSWKFYGIDDVITTSSKISQYVKSLFPNIRTWEIPVGIPEYFNSDDKPKKPIIAIHSREQKDALKIIKTFYLQNPIYKWVTFKDMRGIPRKAFAETLKECCLSVWVDDIAGFGTFPLESIKCGVPVIGKIPNIIPEWMEKINDNGQIDVKNNGVWTNNILHIPNLIAEFMKLWLEDNVPPEISEGMTETAKLYTMEEEKAKIEEVYTHFFNTRIAEIEARLENIINQLQPKEETKVEENNNEETKDK